MKEGGSWIGNNCIPGLSAISTVFGGLGIFFLYYSFRAPELSGYALVLLGVATTIVLSRGKAGDGSAPK